MVRSSQKKVTQIPAPEEEAALKVYRRDGKLYFPMWAFRQSLCEGGKGYKASGRRSVRTILNESIFIADVDQPAWLYDPKSGEVLTEYSIDIRRAVVGTSGVLRARPRIDIWGCDVELEYDPDIMSPEQILEYFNIAGRRFGVGDFRPQKKGTFGRYTAEIASEREPHSNGKAKELATV